MFPKRTLSPLLWSSEQQTELLKASLVLGERLFQFLLYTLREFRSVNDESRVSGDGPFRSLLTNILWYAELQGDEQHKGVAQRRSLCPRLPIC
jgi:hypothetical protein